MSVLLDLLAGAVAAGPFGRRRVRPPGRRVRPSAQLTAAVAAVVVEALALTGIAVAAGNWAFALASDELLFVLGLLLLPMVLALIVGAMAAVAWLALVARRLWARDGSARLDLAAAGMLGVLTATWTAFVGQLVLTVVLGAPAAVCVAVAVSPAAWRPAGSPPGDPPGGEPVPPIRWL